MPGFDRTGPQGQGSRTGRGLGKCNSQNDDPKAPNEGGSGRGLFGNRNGRGRKQGRRRGQGR